MSVQIKDSLSPHLAKMAKQFADRKPILRAGGAELVSITKQNFNDAALRASPWPARRGTSLVEKLNKFGKKKTVTVNAAGEQEHQLLKKSGALWQSIRITNTTNSSITVGTDRIYAAVHQLGAVIRPKTKKSLSWMSGGVRIFAKKVTIPPRPFFPFTADGQMVPAARQRVEAVMMRKITLMMQKP